MMSYIITIPVTILVVTFFVNSLREVVLDRLVLAFDENKRTFAVCFLYVAVCWFLAEGTITCITSYLFYLNLDFKLVYYPISILAILGLVSLYRYKVTFPKKILRNVTLTPYEKIALFLILVIVINYVYRIAVPWYDEDEITQYGFYAKFIASGWTSRNFPPLFGLGFPAYAAESFYGLLYSIKMNAIMPRLFHFFNFMFNAVSMYAIARLITKRRIYGLLAILIFLCTPEFSYMATSMKTDATLMGYELTALLLFFIIVRKMNWGALKFSNGSPEILAISSILVFMGIAIRTTGIYSACMILPMYLISLLRSKLGVVRQVKWALFVFVILNIILITYWLNYYYYDNPFYPLKGVWTVFFKHAKYNFDISYYRQIYNINTNWPPILSYAYIIVYCAFGLGATVFNKVAFLIQPVDKGVAFGWLTPCLLIVFVAPFFIKKSKDIAILFFMFIFVFLIWVHGIEYTRCLFAASSLTILIAIKVISFEREGVKASNIFSVISLTRISVALCIVVIFFYQVSYSSIKYPHSIASFYNEYARYKSNRELLLAKNHRYLPVKYQDVPSFQAVKKIDSYLERFNAPFGVVMLSSPNPAFYHIFFRRGFLIIPQSPDAAQHFMTGIRNKEYIKCALLMGHDSIERYASVYHMFFRVVVDSGKNELMLCR